jgi:aspartyl-tRNA(Asn)/glutamyl-tRNA(Gln) amidotransferase subunit C
LEKKGIFSVIGPESAGLEPIYRNASERDRAERFCPLPSPRPVPRFSAHLPMSQPTALDLDHVARLARLNLTPEEKAVFSQQLDGVLHHIERLGQVDVSGIEPTAHASPVYNVWAEDVPEPGLTVDQALLNAPSRRQNMIVVPKVVE